MELNARTCNPRLKTMSHPSDDPSNVLCDCNHWAKGTSVKKCVQCPNTPCPECLVNELCPRCREPCHVCNAEPDRTVRESCDACDGVTCAQCIVIHDTCVKCVVENIDELKQAVGPRLEQLGMAYAI